MTRSLIEQLRNGKGHGHAGGCQGCFSSIMEDAADEIERQRALLAKAHEALDQMIIWTPSVFAPQSQGNAMKLAYAAREEIAVQQSTVEEAK